MLFINPIHLIISVAFSSSVTPCFFAISFIRYSAISRAEVSISARCSYNFPLVSRLKYSTLLDKFLQITTIFSQETKKRYCIDFLLHTISFFYIYTFIVFARDVTGISLKTIANIEAKQHIPSLLYAMRIADFFHKPGNKPVLLPSRCTANSS